MATKRKVSAMNAEVEEPIDPADELMFLCLGGGNEVGRSCHIIQYKGKTVMLDAGSHAGYSGLAALPFYDDFDLSTVDVLLISHFHIDHAGSLPYVLAKTNFKGRIFMTHPTKSIYKWLLQDSIRVTGANANKAQLYTEEDHLSNFPRIEAIDYHTTHTISSIRITPYPAGHVLGAAMFLIEIAGLKILFTGDYSREEDRHLIPASVPKNVKIDVLITESTYGIASHISRVEREQALMKSITSILNRGGRVLMPVFALGRAQELLLILNEYWSRHKEVQKIPIYYASNLARKCMTVYQTYIGAMNENIRRMFREGMTSGDGGTDETNGKSPWDLRYIRSLKTLERFDDMGECVMLASPGMMQNGVSRHLLERWAPSDKNGVIITGYSVEGTMARMIMSEPDQIPAIMTGNTGNVLNQKRLAVGHGGEKVMIPRRCSVQELSFAAHVDGVENREFIEEVNAPIVILVHGEQHNMMRLKSKLLSLNADRPQEAKWKVFSPRNCEELKIPFKGDKTAKVVGKLASNPATISEEQQEKEAKLLSGVLVQNDFKVSLMSPEDLREYAGLTTTNIICRQSLRLSAAGVELVRWALEGTFGGIEVLSEGFGGKDGVGDVKMNSDGEEADDEIERDTVYSVMGCVTVRYSPHGEVELEWEGNMLNDGIADAVMAVLYSVESSPAAVKQSSSQHNHHHSHKNDINLPTRNPHAHLTPQERLERLFLFLEAQFGANALTPIPTPRIHTTLPILPPTAPPTPKEDPENTEMGQADNDGDNNDDDDDDDDDVTVKKEEDEDDHSSQEDEEKARKEAEAREMARLFKLGIPVPGVEIRVDKMVAKVWLDDLEVECEMKAFGDRVRAVVERAVEVSAPLWQ